MWIFVSLISLHHTNNKSTLSSFCYLLFQDLLEEFKAKIICVSNHLMGLWIFLRMRASVSADFYQVFLYPDHRHMWQKQIVLSLFHHPFSSKVTSNFSHFSFTCLRNLFFVYHNLYGLYYDSDCKNDLFNHCTFQILWNGCT